MHKRRIVYGVALLSIAFFITGNSNIKFEDSCAINANSSIEVQQEKLLSKQEPKMQKSETRLWSKLKDMTANDEVIVTTSNVMTSNLTTTMTMTSSITTSTTTTTDVAISIFEDEETTIKDEIVVAEIPSECIIIHDNTIEIVHARANQYNVDSYDVVQDTDLCDNSNAIYMFGHNNKSFAILDTVSLDESITLVNDGIPVEYTVERSELGILAENGEDVNLLTDGFNIRYQGYESQKLILITCATGYPSNYRWIVIANRQEE